MSSSPDPSSARCLDAAGLARAEAFLAGSRPLEHVLWEHAAGRTSAQAVRDALASFQAPSGGFRHPLEPDIRAPHASPYATTVALQTLLALDTPGDDPLVAGAMRYLADTYDADARTWPMAPAELDTAPHAPWWSLDDDPADRLVNPRAEIVAYGLHYPGFIAKDVVLALLGDILPDLAKRADGLEQHELLCALRLLRAPLAAADRSRLESVLRPVVARLVGHDGEAWSNYGLQPLWIAATPTAPFADDLAAPLAANLDWLLDTQGEDGAWSPAWDWSFVDAEAWATAKREWQGILTVKSLTALQAHGRLGTA